MPGSVGYESAGRSTDRVVGAAQEVAGQLEVARLQAQAEELAPLVLAPQEQSVRFDGGEVQRDLDGFAGADVQGGSPPLVFHRNSRRRQDQVTVATEARRRRLAHG